jgi:hypothetical protein
VRTEAEKKRDEARAHLAARRYTEAYDATAAMIDIWPFVDGAKELAAEIAREYPLVAIGVEQLATAPGSNRIDHWANERVGRLVDRRLIELRGIGPEGGEYVSPVGRWQRSDDNRSLDLTLSPEAMIPSYKIASLLLGGAQADRPYYLPAWSEVVGGVRIVKANQVEATLRRPHVLPHALLGFPLSEVMIGSGQQQSPLAYTAAGGDESHSRYIMPPEISIPSGKPREVLERRYSSAEAAILALQRGEVDALDRVQPSDLAAVRSIPEVKVVRYAVPTLHVLVPNPDQPWASHRTFRRAVMYAINRDVILQQGVLREQSIPGAQLISGPFPAPLAPNDPLSYAYDNSIAPHAYEPLLALTLVNIAKREMEAAAQTRNEKAPPMEELVIGHQPLELHRIASRAMAKQLTNLGVPCQAKELTGDDAELADCDFVYAEIVMSEPAIDVVRLFGPQGLYPATNPHVRLGVRLVQQGTTWNEVGLRLRQLHRTLHEDLTVLPLWQLPQHFAVRPNVQGLSTATVSLYQEIDQWRVAPRLLQE